MFQTDTDTVAAVYQVTVVNIVRSVSWKMINIRAVNLLFELGMH